MENDDDRTSGALTHEGTNGLNQTDDTRVIWPKEDRRQKQTQSDPARAIGIGGGQVARSIETQNSEDPNTEARTERNPGRGALVSREASSDAAAGSQLWQIKLPDYVNFRPTSMFERRDSERTGIETTYSGDKGAPGDNRTRDTGTERQDEPHTLGKPEKGSLL